MTRWSSHRAKLRSESCPAVEAMSGAARLAPCAGAQRAPKKTPHVVTKPVTNLRCVAMAAVLAPRAQNLSTFRLAPDGRRGCGRHRRAGHPSGMDPTHDARRLRPRDPRVAFVAATAVLVAASLVTIRRIRRGRCWPHLLFERACGTWSLPERRAPRLQEPRACASVRDP